MSKIASPLLKKSIMQQFPKIELHRHLEGSFSPEALYSIAHRNKLGYPEDFRSFKDQVQFPRNSRPDFLKFLSKFKNDWYRSLDDVYFITYESVKESADDGLLYLELRFSPEHFALVNHFDRQEVTKLVIEAGNKAAQETGLWIQYLITFNRGKQDQFEMLDLYRKTCALHLTEIIGVDLAGDETNYPPSNFIEFFEYVHQRQEHHITIHAGEVSKSDQIWAAVQQLYAARIGHGTSAIYDQPLQQFLADHRIVLEQCLTSNYQTGAWPNEKTHPINRLLQNKVAVTINSDDPFIQDTTLTEDYLKLVKYFSYSLEDLVQFNRIAIEGSFLHSSQKAELQQKYLHAIAQFTRVHLSSVN